MTDAAAAPSSGTPAKKKRSRAPRSKSSGLKFLILTAVTDNKGRKGTSCQSIKKYVESQRQVNNAAFKRCLCGLVKSGDLIQITGRGACGSYKVPTKPKVAKRRSIVKKKTSTKTKRPTKPKTGAKKTAVKKVSAKKITKKITPKKKTKKPAKKTPTKKSAPKKIKTTKKSPVKKVRKLATKKIVKKAVKRSQK